MENTTRTRLATAMRWALDLAADPANSVADWLASDIDPDHPTAESLLTDPSVSLPELRQAKSAYTTLRIVGERSDDRRLGARLYAAAIAAGIVHHHRRISRQSDEALKRAFNGLLDDENMPEPLRNLAGRALTIMNQAGGLDV